MTKVQVGGDVVYVARPFQLCTSNSMHAAFRQYVADGT
jgi:hypothetical protein